MMLVDFSFDQTARERFEREAKAVARLQHHNVVTIHEVGHALGLFQHSTDSLSDIMASPPRVSLPSDGDRRTVEVLYHTPATLSPPPP